MREEDFRMLRVPELARILGLSRSTLYRLIGQGKLPKPDIAGRWFRSTIENWQSEQTEHKDAPSSLTASHSVPNSTKSTPSD